MSGLGHNGGPALERGASWRRHCWTKARRDLLPSLPIEVLRGRVRRAQDLGLDYRTYASVRASTGRDVVGFLFSTNALRALRSAPAMPADRTAKLAALSGGARIALVVPPMMPGAFIDANPDAALDAVFASAPQLAEWTEARRMTLAALKGRHNLPADAVLLVGDTLFERGWSEAARLAGYVPADRYFGDQDVACP